MSFQEGSVYNSDIDTTNYDRESETHELEVKPIPEMEKSGYTQQSGTTTDPPKLLLQSHKQSSPSSLPTPNFSSQIQGLQEEILHLKGQIALLQSELSSYTPKFNDLANEGEAEYVEYVQEEEEIQENNDQIQSSIDIENTKDNDKSVCTSEGQCETVEIEALQLQQQQTSEFTKITTAQCRKTNNVVCSPSKHSLPTSRPTILGSNYKTSNTFEQPVAKIAERVKLKRTMEDNFIAGNELTGSGVCVYLLIKKKSYLITH